MNGSVSRRDVLKTLALGAGAGSVLSVIPLQAAQYAHHLVKEARAQSPAGDYKPRYFTPHQYQTLRALCLVIIPPDDTTGGAIEAGAPEFIDLLTSENADYQARLGGGLIWLDAECRKRYGQVYLQAKAAEQKQILDLIAYRKNGAEDPSLWPGIRFFEFLRSLTADGFFTSEIGIKYLEFIGNDHLDEFPGCPPLPPL